MSRNQIIKNLEISEEIWDQFCLLRGIIPFCPREKSGKKLQSYYAKKTAATFFKDPFLVKTKEIESWKKFLRLSIQRNLKKFPKKISNFFPFYDFENLITKRFPKFFKVLKQLEEIFPFVFLIIDNPLFENSISEKLNDNSILILEFFYILKYFSSINFIFEMKKAFSIEFKLLGVDIKILLPKKKIYSYKIRTTKKIFSSFLELNISLFKLIVNKFEKLKKFKNFFEINQCDLNLNQRFIFFFKRNFVLQKTKEEKGKTNSKKFFEIYLKIFFKKKKTAKLFRIFSKNFNNPSRKNFFGGIVIFIYQTGQQFLMNFLLNLQGITFIDLKNDKKTLFVIGKEKLFYKSLISIYFDFSWIFFCMNTKTYLPMKKNCIKKNKLKELNPFYQKINKIKKSSTIIFRNKFKIQKILENEKKSTKKRVIFFLNKNREFFNFFPASFTNPKVLFQCIRKSIS
ncbi:nop-like protein (nucleomorph) [Hemiselmis andersenii]|uniref:Nop-like protein n=1 Tax=Hemiselmis andersenii TaxID=464988 RepID=A9BK35_HEMAN|nr:nop-like protein [Hemiselmis andersenii]ABW97868.1 nop-like protein [Hemiselmis andersenii]